MKEARGGDAAGLSVRGVCGSRPSPRGETGMTPAGWDA